MEYGGAVLGAGAGEGGVADAGVSVCVESVEGVAAAGGEFRFLSLLLVEVARAEKLFFFFLLVGG